MDFFEQLIQVISSAKSSSLPPDSPIYREFLRDREIELPDDHARESTDNIPQCSGQDLDTIARTIANCTACTLCRTRTKTVPGEGDPHAGLMFIGEGPGADENAAGRPFVGKAGQLLDRMITAMQFKREEVYITNVVKCRPPDNRAPAPEEAGACINYLKAQIEAVKPQVIVLLGASAAKYLLGVQEGITKLRGRWLSYENIPVMPTFHPAYLLRQESAKKEAWQDLQQVMAKFGKVHPGR